MVTWTTDNNKPPGHNGLRFGLSKTPGPRHLFIGFTESIPVSTRDNVRVAASGLADGGRFVGSGPTHCQHGGDHQAGSAMSCRFA